MTGGIFDIIALASIFVVFLIAFILGWMLEKNIKQRFTTAIIVFSSLLVYYFFYGDGLSLFFFVLLIINFVLYIYRKIKY